MSVEGTSVGLDVHALLVVGCAIEAETGRVQRRRLCPDPGEILGWVNALEPPVRVVYEAGPTGFGLYRALTAAGIETVVVAPSKLQRPSGDRVKTDFRDALHLARLLRLGEVVAVRVPSVTQEAARDLVRAREDARIDLMRHRHRLSKLLLRQGIVYSGGSAWTAIHESWLRAQHFDQPALQAAYDNDYEAMMVAKTRRDRLDSAIAELAAHCEYTPIVHRLGCLRGISTLTGFALAVEIGDWHRFTGNTIGSYLGLVPSERSSGVSRVQGSITKTGNGHARRLLVESAWHHRKPYGHPGRAMAARWALASPAARARGHAGNHRLLHQWELLICAGWLPQDDCSAGTVPRL
ncbi:IS110 family transposase [Nocardia sp. NPDC020380]|uniref:IS110 family transposase n=1 Tax=Nocardia sp. NPDC020380 TaxID=3364309 RepID=UPI00378F12E7